ncbi:Bestrophin, RFP-TM, chloride channel-domain-containing protein [Mycena capillaripes]|nr:Bestrophin, RFP-TM, chloride channel-domain-containing protein [Mycena capillaripes]
MSHVTDDTLQRTETFTTHKGFAAAADPFAPRRRPGASFFNALLATAFFRCWHILMFFAAWATVITVLDHHHFKVRFASTLLTVVGTVLGFVVSYRTTSSFERYNEGRRLWSQIILASRTFSRTVWFHVPDQPATKEVDATTIVARGMVEKRRVAVKHYLRGEDGIYYQDLYYLVKFLPAYALPAGIPPTRTWPTPRTVCRPPRAFPTRPRTTAPHSANQARSSTSAPPLPTPCPCPRLTSRSQPRRRPPRAARASPQDPEHPRGQPPPCAAASHHLPAHRAQLARREARGRRRGLAQQQEHALDQIVLARADESFLLPGSLPPKYHFFDLFPFSLLVRCLTKRGHEVKGKKAARMRAKMHLYLSSYIAALQKRKQTDVPTINTLLASLNNLVDALTGLERILTTPIPFSYSIHLWLVTTFYCLALPSQIVSTMQWLTIPGTILLTFIFFGFLVAGEEIENPFGYDKNDLNLDHFTNSIIRTELRAITSAAAPDPDRWMFSPENDLLFASDVERDERVGPNEWVRRGTGQMLGALSVV